MPYAFMFGPDGIKPVESLGKHGPVIVGDLLAIWHTDGKDYPDYLIDGLEGGMTPIGTFEKEVGAATFRDGMLLIATQEYVDAYRAGMDTEQHSTRDKVDGRSMEKTEASL